MNRRIFLRNTTLTGAALPVLSLSACFPDHGQADAAATAPAAAGAGAGFALHEATVADLQSTAWPRAPYTRPQPERAVPGPHRRNRRQGPTLRAVIETNPDALAIADAARRGAQSRQGARAPARHSGADQGQHRHRRPDADHGRLAGAGRAPGQRRMPSSCSSCGRPGAVLLGKTNLSEWANFRSTHSVSGWSSRGGQTPQPVLRSTAAPAAPARARARRWRPTCAPWPSAPKPTARWCRRRRATARGPQAHRGPAQPQRHHPDFRPPRTRPAPWPAPCATRPCCWAPSRPRPGRPGHACPSPANTPADYTPFLKADALKGQRLGVEKAAPQRPAAPWPRC